MIFTGNPSFQEGMVAYINAQYETAAESLRKALESDPKDWNAKFFLAMCLAQGDQLKAARFHLMCICEQCPVVIIRQRASALVHTLDRLS